MRGSVMGCVVTLPDLTPVAGAVISGVGPGARGLRPIEDDGLNCGLSHVGGVSDDSGAFYLEALEEGRWILDVRGEGGETGRATVHVCDNAVSDVTVEVPITKIAGGLGTETRAMKQPGRRRGTGGVRGRVVIARDSTPIADAAITVVRGPAPAPDISPLTDPSGWFTFDGLSPGIWLLRALGPDGSSGDITARVNAGAMTEVTLKLEFSMSPDKEPGDN